MKKLGKKINNFGRTASHRQAMMSNMACSLIQHGHVTTTAAKAKFLRSMVEKLVTRAKVDSLHNRRVVLSTLRSWTAVNRLFTAVAPACRTRAGGYLRIVRLGLRLSDNSDMAIISFVDQPVAAAAATAAVKPAKPAKTAKKK